MFNSFLQIMEIFFESQHGLRKCFFYCGPLLWQDIFQPPSMVGISIIITHNYPLQFIMHLFVQLPCTASIHQELYVSAFFSYLLEKSVL